MTELEARAKRVEADLEAERGRSAARERAAVAVAEARLEETKRRVAACEADRVRREGVYEGALDRCQSRAWWRSPTLWTVVGTAVGAGACGLAVGVGK